MTNNDRAKLKVRPREVLYIACENWDFSWTQKEIATVKIAWNAGRSIQEISDLIDNRDVEEIAILLMDLRRQYKIKTRKCGVFGVET